MKTFLIVTVSVTLLICGCSSNPKVNFNIEPRYVTIVTDPAGATVKQINPWNQPPTSLGLTPITERSVVVVSGITKASKMSYSGMKRMYEQVNNVVVRIEKDGYESYYGTLRTDPEETVVHNITLQPKK